MTDWKTYKLRRVTQLFTDKIDDTNLKYVGLENVEAQTGKHIETAKVEIESVALSFQQGDVLFGKLRPYLAKCFIPTFNGICSSEFLVLRGEKVLNLFLQYFLLSPESIDRINSSTYGAKMPRANWDFIGNMEITLPPLSTQQKITTYLDQKTATIDTLISDKESLLTLLAEERQAIISEAVTKGLDRTAEMKDSGVEWIGEIPVGWEVEKFKHNFSTRTGISITKAEFVKQGIPCLNYGDIHSRYKFDLDIERDVLKKAPSNLLESKKSSLLAEDDFVFCDTSEDLDGCGNCLYVKNTANMDVFGGSHTTIARPINEFSSRYVAYQFSTAYWRRQVRNSVSGVKVFSITQAILNSTGIIFPPLETQHQIVQYLDEKTSKIDQIVLDTKEQIKLLKEYRQSLISEVVTGKVEI
ncbi:MAG: restriction endonuclease subunit S [Eubacteriales bacterium]